MNLTICLFSGTFRALQIASSYPDTVGRFVLDGAVPHGVVGGSHSHQPFRLTNPS